MQRLVLATLLLGMLAGGLALAVASARAALRLGTDAGAGPLVRGSTGSGAMQKLSYAALFLLILGVATGWLGGL